MTKKIAFGFDGQKYVALVNDSKSTINESKDYFIDLYKFDKSLHLSDQGSDILEINTNNLSQEWKVFLIERIKEEF